jgi:hypothetical protein
VIAYNYGHGVKDYEVFWKGLQWFQLMFYAGSDILGGPDGFISDLRIISLGFCSVYFQDTKNCSLSYV